MAENVRGEEQCAGNAADPERVKEKKQPKGQCDQQRDFDIDATEAETDGDYCGLRRLFFISDHVFEDLKQLLLFEGLLPPSYHYRSADELEFRYIDGSSSHPIKCIFVVPKPLAKYLDQLDYKKASNAQTEMDTEAQSNQISNITALDACVMEIVENVRKNRCNPDMNEITELNQLCQRFGVQQPTYEYVCAKGLAHKLEHTVSCQLYDLKALGVGSSKSRARRHAASLIVDMLVQDTKLLYGLHDKHNELMAEKAKKLKDAQLLTASKKKLKKCKNQDQPGSTVDESLETDEEGDFPLVFPPKPSFYDIPIEQWRYDPQVTSAIEHLQSLSKAHNFGIVSEVERSAKPGLFQCLICLGFKEPVYLGGLGEQEAVAENNTAAQALNYVETMAIIKSKTASVDNE